MYPSGVDCPPRDNAQPSHWVAPVTLGNVSTRRIVADNVGHAEKSVGGISKQPRSSLTRQHFFPSPSSTRARIWLPIHPGEDLKCCHSSPHRGEKKRGGGWPWVLISLPRRLAARAAIISTSHFCNNGVCWCFGECVGNLRGGFNTDTFSALAVN